MTEAHPDVIVAARQLLQWGRARQSAWHDASKDLLAALGNRYASFEQPLQEWTPAPPPPSAPPHGAQPAALPDIQVRPPVALPLPPTVTPTPIVTPSPIVTPPPIITSSPIVTSTPIVAAPPPPVRSAPTPNLREQVPVAVTAPPTRRLGYLSFAAAVILALAAVPALWRTYEASRVVAPTTNTLTIESTPPGSVVFVDGVESGKTPLTLTAAIGVHKVELRYRKKVRAIDVDVTAGSAVVTSVDWTKSTSPAKRSPGKNATSSKTGKSTPPAAPTGTGAPSGAHAASAGEATSTDDQPAAREESPASAPPALETAPSTQADERP